MNKISTLQIFMLELIAEKLVIQGSCHYDNIKKYFNIMYISAFKYFNEDNNPTLKSFLLEAFIESIDIDKEYAIKLLKR